MDSIKGLGSEDDDMEDEAPYNQVGGGGLCSWWVGVHTHMNGRGALQPGGWGLLIDRASG